MRFGEMLFEGGMLPTDPNMIAVCDLDCSTCELLLAHKDREVAQTACEWWQEESWLQEGQGVDAMIIKLVTTPAAR